MAPSGVREELLQLRLILDLFLPSDCIYTHTYCKIKGFFLTLSLLQVFYWSHLSYVWVWSLLMVHCANFWKWFVVPGLFFMLEKIIGIAVSRMGGLYIVEVNLLPSKVSDADGVSLFKSQARCDLSGGIVPPVGLRDGRFIHKLKDNSEIFPSFLFPKF